MENVFKIEYKVNDDFLNEMLKLDKSVYNGKNCGVLRTCKEWISVNNEIYTMLLCDGEIIGYINFMPITDECYNSFIKGEKRDYQITNKDILPFSKDKGNKCLLTSVLIREDFRDGIAIQYLLNGFFERLKKYKDENILISKIVLDCVSEDGEKFAKRYFDAKFIRQTKTGKIYESDLASLNI